MFELLAHERANKSALLLIHDRYETQFSSFVKNSKVRLSYVATQLDELIDEVVNETGADFAYVKAHFDQYLADAVLDPRNDAKHEDLNYKTQDDGVPPVRNEDGDPLDGQVVEDDVQNMGEIDGAGADEARQPDATVDLAQETKEGPGASEAAGENYTTRSNVVTAGETESCVRCGNTLNPVVAKHTPVCPACTSELKKKAVSPGMGGDYIDDNNQSMDYLNDTPVQDQNLQYNCTICGPNVIGTRDEIYSHVQQSHPDAIAAKQQEMMGLQDTQQTPALGKATLDIHQADVPDAIDPDRAEVQPLPETPADHFDEVIQDLANRAAARQFSAASEQDINGIANQLGVDPQQVREALVAVATFGDYTGTNGQSSEQSMVPEGYQEISLQGLGGRVDSHEALVPVDNVVNKVADAMNMEPNLVYQQVRDKYGADLPDKYHASVSGEIHYYLPSEMAAAAQPQPEPVAQDPNVGPAAPPAPEPTQ